MSDELIRKSDVIDLLNSLGLNLIDYGSYSQLFDTVDNMPPVNAVEMNDDLISRQAAISVTWNAHNTGDACRELRALPSVQPEIELKTGHWIEDAKTYYEELKKRSLGVDEYTPYFTDDIACSECLAKYSVLDNETQFFKYCPNCGAKMESEDNENE